jgi:hypothetical protein
LLFSEILIFDDWNFTNSFLLDMTVPWRSSISQASTSIYFEIFCIIFANEIASLN